MIEFSETPVTTHEFEGITFYLKRDDLLHPQFSGNKARKLYTLLNTPLDHVDTFIGYGSVQANSLYSIAALARLRHRKLEFYVHHIPDWLKHNPVGNYKAALELGANIIDVSSHSKLSPYDYIHQVRKPNERCLVIPEGGRSPLAEVGVKKLATELLNFIRYHQLKDIYVVLPSGTGTTSLYLHKYLHPHDVTVVTCPTVGDKDYLLQQCHSLEADMHPTIWEPPQKYHFGTLYKPQYQLWKKLNNATHVEFELLYDTVMWQTLLFHREKLEGKTLLYIHQGGVVGNESMRLRYERKWPELEHE